MDGMFRSADVSGIHAGGRSVRDEPRCGRRHEPWRGRGQDNHIVRRSLRGRVRVIALLCCAWAGAWSGHVHAQSGSAVVSVDVDTVAISVRNLRGLDFGTFLPYGRTGTIVLLADGSIQVNNVHLLDPAAAHPASWDIAGTPGAPYAVSIPTIANVVANGMSMSISPLFRSGPASLTLDATGQGRIDIGGVLNIPPNIVPGVYSGVFAVTVHYN